jgi:hypothetical protein
LSRRAIADAYQSSDVDPAGANALVPVSARPAYDERFCQVGRTRLFSEGKNIDNDK